MEPLNLPKIVTFSVHMYRLLLAAYPRSFREAYGPHMLQVFGDACLRTYKQFGVLGLFHLWNKTLLDFVQTVFEEHLHKEASMSKDKLTRLTGWMLILAGFSSLIWFFYINYRVSNVTEDQMPIVFTDTIPFVTLGIGMNWLVFFGFYGVYILFKNTLGKIAPVSIGLIFLTTLWDTLYQITIRLDFSLLPIALQENTIRQTLGILGITGFGVLLAKYKPLPKLNNIILITNLATYLLIYILNSSPATDILRSLDRVYMNHRLLIFIPVIALFPIGIIILGSTLISNLKQETPSGQNTPLTASG